MSVQADHVALDRPGNGASVTDIADYVRIKLFVVGDHPEARAALAQSVGQFYALSNDDPSKFIASIASEITGNATHTFGATHVSGDKHTSKAERMLADLDGLRALVDAGPIRPADLARRKLAFMATHGYVAREAWAQQVAPFVQRFDPRERQPGEGAAAHVHGWETDCGLPLSRIVAGTEVAEEPEPVTVARFIAYRGTQTCFYANAKVGKTSMLAAAAAAVTVGGDWLGEPTTAGTVLWLRPSNAEGGRLETVRSILTRFDADLSRVLFVPAVSWYDDPVGEVAALVRAIRPTMAVLDTLSALSILAGAERGNAQTWQPIFHEIGMAAEATGAAFVHLHHKPEGADRPRDSTAIAAGVDLLADFRRNPTETQWTLRLMGRVGLVPVVTGDTVVSPLRRRPTRYHLAEDMPLPDLLGDEHPLELRVCHLLYQRPMSQNDVRETLGCRRESLADAWAGLKAGPIEQRGRGNLAKWHLSDPGTAYLQGELAGRGMVLP